MMVCAGAYNIAETQRCAAVKLGGIQRAGHAAASLVQNVRVDHCRFDARVSKEFLHSADVVSVFEQVRRETGPERVARGSNGNTRRISPVPGGDVKQILEGN